jgi:hypothetical protein
MDWVGQQSNRQRWEIVSSNWKLRTGEPYAPTNLADAVRWLFVLSSLICDESATIESKVGPVLRAAGVDGVCRFQIDWRQYNTSTN